VTVQWPLRAELNTPGGTLCHAPGTHAARVLPEAGTAITACAVVVNTFDWVHDDLEAYPVTCRACAGATKV
jgi:hypothetical protein